MALDGGVSDAQAIMPWVAGLGILINLVWNLGNTIHTKDVAAKIRVEQRQVERWDRLRNRIETTLDTFVSEVKAGHLVVAKAANTPQIIPVIEVLELDIVLKQDELAKALEAADKSDCCENSDWSHLANGPAIYAGETSWDMILTVLSSAASAGTRQVDHLKRLTRYADDIDTAVREALEAQDKSLLPQPRPRFSIWSGTARKD